MHNEINIVNEITRAAGEAILHLQKTGFSIAQKGENDIVTKADLVANEILKTGLLTHFPRDGWLSEESVDDNTRFTCDRVWIVDPIDGTREFASGIPEYAVSVALVEKGTPILASVFNPETNEFFHAQQGAGAYLNNKRIYCRPAPAENYLLLASRSECKRGEWRRFEAHHQVKPIGSIAYKLALLAAGCAEATFSLGPKNEWDIAAGTLIVTEAGGIVTNKHRQPLQFNRALVKVDGIVATSAHSNEQIFNLIHAE